MVELQSCASLVSASALSTIEHEARGESAINAIVEISAELQRERQRNAELMERISALEAQIRERGDDSLLSSGQANCRNTRDSKPKRQKVATDNSKLEDEDIKTDLEMKHNDTYVPVKDMNVDNRLVNWMNIDDTHESLHSEILKESNSAADHCDDTDDTDDEEVCKNDICTNYEGGESFKDINRADEVKGQSSKRYTTEKTDAQCLVSSSSGHDEPKDTPVNQECNEYVVEKCSNLSLNPVHKRRKYTEHHRKGSPVIGGHQESSQMNLPGQEMKRVGNVSSHKKHPKIAFCPKEIKRIIGSEELLRKNAQSHTIRKIIVFASLGIRHGCEDMYELDFNHFAIVRQGEPYISSKDPGFIFECKKPVFPQEHVFYENPGVRRKIFYPNRQNPTLCPVQILEEEKAMRPPDSSCPSFLFLCIKYGGRTRNIPQNDYVRQRMGRNKLKSFGPAICRMAMLVHIRSGSFFFKALGITLLFMAGFPDDQVQRETKYRNLDLLQKYYRTDEDAEGEELFLSRLATTDTDVSPISQQLMGKKMSTNSKSRRPAKVARKDQEKAIFLQSAPSNSGPSPKFELLRNDSIQTQANTPVQYIASQAQAASSIPNRLISSISCHISNTNQQSSYPFIPPHPASSIVPIIYMPPPNAFLSCPHPTSHSYPYPIVGNYISSYRPPYYSNPSCNTLIPKPLKDSRKDDTEASEADNDSKSSSSSTGPTKSEN